MTEEIDKLVDQLGNDGEIKILESDDTMTKEHKFRQAISAKVMKTVEEVLEKKLVDINCTHPETFQTPLHIACSIGSLEIVKLLLGVQGIKVDLKDHYQNTPRDLLGNDKESNEIRKLFEAMETEEEGMKSPVEKFGEIIPIQELKGYEYHVYLVHSYKDKTLATTLKDKFEALGIKVGFTNSMIADEGQVSKLVQKCKLILILASSSLFEKLRDPETFKKSPCVLEMNAFIDERDVSEILILGRDKTGNKLTEWEECVDYSAVAEEGVVFDVSNAKVLEETLPQLYKEIKLRVV